MEDCYLEISRGTQIVLKVKGSRFIGETCRVGSSDEAAVELEKIRKREYSATHHCYAWQVGLHTEQSFKYSDDGEPNGTAGRPIYDAIAGRNVTNLLLVVTRYFGGTKLGTGGLARAYAEAAREALDQSGTRQRLLCSAYRFHLEFSRYDLFQRILHRFEAVVKESQFSDLVMLEVEIRRSHVEELLTAFSELCAGKGEVEKLGDD